jgi:pimeloyl-ACP methyl ester carboxylesterase
MAESVKVRANGIRLHVLRDGEGPPLLLLHGWPEFARVWRRVMPLLAPDFTLFAPDMRGFGDSENPNPGPSDQVTADVLAADIAALLDVLPVAGRVGLVGHDVGSFVMQAFARRWPERLAGLFFFNCAYPGIGGRWAAPEQLKEIWYQSFQQKPWAAELVGQSRDSVRLYFTHFLRHWAGDPNAFDEVIEEWVDNFMKPGNLQGGFNWYISVNASRIAAMKGEAPKPPPIDVPTRVLWGGRDPVLKAEWRDRLPEFFTDVEVSVAERAGHFVHWEDPHLAAREIKAFFTRIGHG